MFKNLIKALENIEGEQSFSVPIESDEKGYIDKQCPSKDCEFIFKVNKEDWGNISNDKSVWCPFCRHQAPLNQWFTIEQVKHAKGEVLAVTKEKIHNALRNGAKEFNRSQPKNSFVSISMEVSGESKRIHIMPAKAADIMQLEILCEKCKTRFSVIGSAYFCPVCGHNSVTRTFSDSLRKIRAKKENVEVVRKALIDSVGKDEAELTCRSMMETCISDGVVAFQKYCEGMYKPYGKAPFNSFQRLDQASILWKKAIQKSFDFWLTTEELNKLKVVYQKRHLLAHNDGIVDSTYIQKSGDTFYKEGQRIVILNRDIDLLLSALEKLGNGIKNATSDV